jgi:protein phosphatase
MTDKGLARNTNQDDVLSVVKENGDSLYVLCDGMGGHAGGAVACKKCISVFKNEFKKSKYETLEDAKEWLYKSILKANKEIIQAGNKDINLKGMGTTVVCLLISKDFKVCASVGDSRLYAYNKKCLTQISEDQTFAAALYKAGYINEKEVKNHPRRGMLLCAVGSTPSSALDVQIKEVKGNDNYLICSDGLYNMVEENKIKKILDEDISIKEKVDKLINEANDNGGFDNVSVILLEASV